MQERTLRISSLGKTFSVTGWKIGWATGWKIGWATGWKIGWATGPAGLIETLRRAV